VATHVFAQEEYEGYEVVNYEDIPGLKIPPAPGMKIMKVGSAYVSVPKGSKVYSMNNIIFVESAKQYSSRRFMDVDKRLDSIDEKLNKLETDINQLKTILNKPKTKVLFSQSEE